MKRPRDLSVVAREARKIIEDRCNEVAMPRVFRRQARGVQIQDISSFGSGFRPRLRRMGEKLIFERGLAMAQFSRVVLNLNQGTAQIGRPLRSHSPVLVEI